MRHRVQRNYWHAWADIGAGRWVVDVTRNGVRIPFKSGPPAPFHQGASMEDAMTLSQLRFMDIELARFLASGAWEERHCSRHFRGRRMLPYMDDLLFFASIRAQAYAPAWFYLRELHDVLRTKNSWSGRVKMTHQLRRNLEWWVAVPNHSNGRSIYKPAVETAYRLSEMASEVLAFPPSPDLFALGRLGIRTGVGSPKWPVVAFRLFSLRARCAPVKPAGALKLVPQD
eukprot:jgi/Tetstr1/465283/TSEL_009984.t1